MSATASNEVETNMEQLERNKLHEEKFYDALNADRLEKEMNCKKSTYQRLLTRNECNKDDKNSTTILTPQDL